MEKIAPIDDLLSDASHDIEFNGTLTNHSKHAVIALQRLGATPKRIAEFYHNYVRETPYGYGVEPAIAPTHVITEADWRSHIGKRTSWSAWCVFFDRKVDELGLDEVLRRYLPVLLGGWAGALMHGTIHLGWALDIGSRRMTVEGIAYMAYAYVSVHPERVTSRGRDADPLAALQRIAGVWDGDGGALKQWVQDLLARGAAGDAPGVHPDLGRAGLQFRISMLLHAGHPLFYDVPKATFDQLYYAVTLLYLTTPGDFALLHFITALHAMEKIAERLPDGERGRIVELYWLGLIGILFTRAGFPAQVSSPSWTRATAVRSTATPNRPNGMRPWRARCSRSKSTTPSSSTSCAESGAARVGARSIGTRRRFSPRRPTFPRSLRRNVPKSRASPAPIETTYLPGMLARRKPMLRSSVSVRLANRLDAAARLDGPWAKDPPRSIPYWRMSKLRGGNASLVRSLLCRHGVSTAAKEGELIDLVDQRKAMAIGRIGAALAPRNLSEPPTNAKV